MDKIFLWQRVQVLRDEILQDIEILLSNEKEIDIDIIEQAKEIKKFLLNDHRMKESLNNEGFSGFLQTAGNVMKTAREEWEMKEKDKEEEM